MNYLVMLKAFYKSIEINPLSPKAQCLYNYLLYKNNEFGWIKAFTLSNLTICGQTNLSRQELDKSRNELKQKGYINYVKGTSNQAGTYSINETLCVRFDTQSDTQSDTQTRSQTRHIK